jgi:predicted nucleic acid-binding protein
MAFGGAALILLADTSILIDLEYVGGIDVLPRIAPCEILDVVLDECEHASQPDLVQNIRESGITVIEATIDLANKTTALRRGGVSTIDMMTLCHAKEHGHTVLAGDRPLRERCNEESVAVRGSIWIVEEAHRQQLLESAELICWLTVWPTIGRRLPAEELERLRQLLTII